MTDAERDEKVRAIARSIADLCPDYGVMEECFHALTTLQGVGPVAAGILEDIGHEVGQIHDDEVK